MMRGASSCRVSLWRSSAASSASRRAEDTVAATPPSQHLKDKPLPALPDPWGLRQGALNADRDARLLEPQRLVCCVLAPGAVLRGVHRARGVPCRGSMIDRRFSPSRPGPRATAAARNGSRTAARSSLRLRNLICCARGRRSSWGHSFSRLYLCLWRRHAACA
jgi:hypothetical protein